jgi:gamma-glutamylcyclotransferase
VNVPLIFSYGSNMDTARMKARCPRANAITSATLRGYRLAFGGYSARWGGGVATVELAKGAWVHGLLYRVPPRDLDLLDAAEGVPVQYQRVSTRLRDACGRRHLVHLYLLNSPARMAPSVDYLTTILRAYERLGFPRRDLLDAAMRTNYDGM